MAIKFKEIRRFLARNTRLSICFLDGQYHNYLLVSDIPASEYDELYVYGIGITDVEFSLDIYSEPDEISGGSKYIWYEFYNTAGVRDCIT